MPVDAGARRPRTPPFINPPGYARHRAEVTQPYQIVEQYYPEFLATREAANRRPDSCRISSRRI